MGKYLKDLTIISFFLAFLYLCGMLFFISFWSTFDIDVSPFVSIQDVPKNFIYSLLPNLIRILIVVIPVYYIGDVFFSAAIDRALAIRVSSKLDIWQLVSIMLMIVLMSILTFDLIKSKIIFWVVTSLIFVAIVIYSTINLQPFIRFFPSGSKRVTILALVLIPITSTFLITKGKSLEILENTTNPTIKIYPIDSTIEAKKQSLKFLGYVGDKLIVSSLDNKKKFILNQSSLLGVEMIDSSLNR